MKRKYRGSTRLALMRGRLEQLQKRAADMTPSAAIHPRMWLDLWMDCRSLEAQAAEWPRMQEEVRSFGHSILGKGRR